MGCFMEVVTHYLVERDQKSGLQQGVPPVASAARNVVVLIGDCMRGVVVYPHPGGEDGK